MRVWSRARKDKLKDKWYTAQGRLRYCPNSGWVVMDIPNSIIYYYAWWVKKLTWKRGSPPLHKGHVTVVNGKFDDVRKEPAWALRQGALINFRYNSVIYTDPIESYYWLLINCPELINVRKELNLRPFPKWPFHATVYYIDR